MHSAINIVHHSLRVGLSWIIRLFLSGPAPHPCGRRCSRWRVFRLPSSGCSAQWQKDGYHSMSGCPLLAALRYAAFSSSAPNRPPLALRVVACREAIRAGIGLQTGALLITRTRTAGYVGWPRTLARGLGRPLQPARPEHHRPTQPGVLPTAGNDAVRRTKTKREPLRRAT